MAVEWIHVCLRAWRSSGEIVGRELFDLLSYREGDAVRIKESTSAYQTSLIFFVDESLEEHTDATERHESFNSAIEARLLSAAAWLESRDPDAFDRCRAAGLQVDVLIYSWIDQDQFEVTLPPSFLRACGNAGLSIEVITND